MRKIKPPIRELISDSTADFLGEIAAAEYTTKVVVNLLTKTTHSIDEIAAILEVPGTFCKGSQEKVKNK